MWSVGVSLFIIATRINFYETKPRSPRELQHRLLRMLAVDSADAIRATVQLSPVLERTLTREDSITMRAFLHRKIVEEGVNVDLQRCKRVQLVDLLANLLTWSAADRLSAAEALRHPFFGRTCYGPRMADSHSFDAVDQFGRMSSTETDAGYQDPLRIYHGEPTQLAAQRARSLRSHAISIAESAAVLEGARAEDEYNNANYDGDDERNEGADNAQDEPPIVRRRGRFRYVLDDDLPVLGGRRRLSAVFDE